MKARKRTKNLIYASLNHVLRFTTTDPGSSPSKGRLPEYLVNHTNGWQTSPDQVSHPKGKDTLDLKVSAAYSRILHGELGAHICLLEQKIEVVGEMLSGRDFGGTLKICSFLSAEHGAASGIQGFNRDRVAQHQS